MKPLRPEKVHRGVIVPMVTPVTSSGSLDEAGVNRLVAHLRTGGVHGVFVLGTTGEGSNVPPAVADQLVSAVLKAANGALKVYAGVSGNSPHGSVETGNRFLAAGVDAVVAHVPASYELHPQKSLQYFLDLASRLDGDLVLYNMPLTTNVSLPIAVCKEAARKPRVIGIKDSENNSERLGELLRELGGRDSFSVLVGTGPLMATGLLQGADGIVPSVANIAPRLCRQLYDKALEGDRPGAERIHSVLMELSQVYQKGRTLENSLAALKGAMTWLGLCDAYVWPPLNPVQTAERLAMRAELARLGVPVRDVPSEEHQSKYWPYNGGSNGDRPQTMPASPG